MAHRREQHVSEACTSKMLDASLSSLCGFEGRHRHRQMPRKRQLEALRLARDPEVGVAGERVADLDEIDTLCLQVINNVLRVGIRHRANQRWCLERQWTLQDWPGCHNLRTNKGSAGALASKTKDVIHGRRSPFRAMAVIRSPSTMTVTTRGRAPVPSMRVTSVTAIAFDWTATTVAHAVMRDTTIRSRDNRRAIPTRATGVRFIVRLTMVSAA